MESPYKTTDIWLKNSQFNCGPEIIEKLFEIELGLKAINLLFSLNILLSITVYPFDIVCIQMTDNEI